MITYDLQNRNGQPMYEYLYECIRQDIIRGELVAGEKLPSKRAFANHLNVGNITVEKAYEQLLVEGYIRSVERSGYYVENLEKYSKDLLNRRQSSKMHQEEPEYFMDFKANRISLTKFPVSTWSKLMKDTLTLKEDSLYKPVSYKGLYELRVAIANYLKRSRGMEVDPELMIIGAGTEYLYGRLFQLLGREYVFGMENPGYAKISKIADIHGNRWEPIPIDDGGLRVDVLEESDADIVHVSPANQFPTGMVMSVRRRLELFEWANKVHKRYIIEDDYDCEFRYSGRMILPLYAIDEGEKVIYTNTFSKTLVPSLRISYMILPKNLMERFEKTMSFYSCTVSSFEQYTLARFIEEGYFEKHIIRMKYYYRRVRSQVMKVFQNSELSQISRIEEHNAGTHFLMHIQTNMAKQEIKEKAARQELLLSFYSDYSSKEETEDGCTLVINYASIQPEQVEHVIDRLCEIFL